MLGQMLGHSVSERRLETRRTLRPVSTARVTSQSPHPPTPRPHSPVTQCHRAHARHTETSRFNRVLPFPVVQNTAAVVFQREAGGAGHPCSVAAFPGPGATSASPVPPMALQFSMQNPLSPGSLHSVPCSPVCSAVLARPGEDPLTHERNSLRNRKVSLTGTVVR